MAAQLKKRATFSSFMKFTINKPVFFSIGLLTTTVFTVIFITLHQAEKINGMELLEKIKTAFMTKAIPAVMLTSSKKDSGVQKYYNPGLNSYIAKPVNFESYTGVIKPLLSYWLLLNEPPAK